MGDEEHIIFDMDKLEKNCVLVLVMSLIDKSSVGRQYLMKTVNDLGINVNELEPIATEETDGLEFIYKVLKNMPLEDKLLASKYISNAVTEGRMIPKFEHTMLLKEILEHCGMSIPTI